MKSLKGFDHGKSTPVDCIDVPDGNGTYDTGKAVAKQPNRDGTQDHGGRAQRQVIEEVLRCEHVNASRTIGGGCSSDRAYCVLLQVPRPRIEKGDDRDPSGTFSLAAFLPPSRLISIATGEKSGPSFAEEVGDDNDKGSLDGDIRWFELDGKVSLCWC